MRKLLSITAIAFLITVSSVACSGSAQDLMPLAPSAAPSATISVEAGDAVDTWDTSGKDKDRPKGDDRDKGKGKGKDREDSTTSQTVEVEGAVGTVTGACPAKTFTVGQHSIVTNSQTTYDDGLCAELVPLARVEVRAVKQADGTLVATKVEFEDEDADDEDANDVKVEGIVSGLSGTCPAISFTAGGKTISTSATTEFHETTCAAVQNGTRVRARGTLQTNGSVLARRVDLRDVEDDDEDEEDDDGNRHHGAGPHHGTVSSFRGTCPVVTFNLKGLRISTTSATTYVGGACETLRPNVQVLVTGTLGTEPRTFTATTIAITRTH